MATAIIFAQPFASRFYIITFFISSNTTDRDSLQST